jgi:ABC-2 type transport system permease protein
MRRGFVIALLGLPLAHLGMGALIGFAMQTAMRDAAPTRPVALVDPRGVLRRSTDSDAFFAAEGAALEALRERSVDAVFVLDEEYVTTGRVRAYAAPAPGFLQLGVRLSQRERAAHAIRRSLASEVPPTLRARIVEPVLELSSYSVRGASISAEPPVAILGVLAGPFGVCFILGLAIFLVSGTLQQAMSAELQNRMLEVLLLRVTPHQMLLGKTLGLAAAGLIQVAAYLTLVLTSTPALSPGEIPLSMLLWSGAVFMAGYILFAALLAGTGAVAGESHESTQIASLCLLAAAVPFFFITHLSAHPYSLLSRALTWFPPTGPVALLLRIGVDGVGTTERVLVLALIAGAGAVALRLAAWLFALRIRLTGRLQLRQILRIRGAAG